MLKLVKRIKKDTGYSTDIVIRNIKIFNTNIVMLFNEVLSDGETINNFILKPLSNFVLENKKSCDLYSDLFSILSANNIVEVNSYNSLIDYIYKGFTILIINNKVMGVETKAPLTRSITVSETESSITGPKEAFVEDFNKNIGLIRKRIRNNKLYVSKMYIGKQSNTLVGLCYMNNIVNKELVLKIKNMLKSINVDGVIDSGNIRDKLVKKDSFLPVVNSTERPDLVSMALLEGKVAIVVDNSPYVLILPSFFVDFFHTADDYYQKPINITFIRIACFYSSNIFASSLY